MDDGLRELKHTDIIAFATAAEQLFIAAGKTLLRNGGIPVSVFLAETAFECDVSIETARRYLAKHSASRAEFRMEGGFVYLR